jgi:hypothetical protein
LSGLFLGLEFDNATIRNWHKAAVAKLYIYYRFHYTIDDLPVIAHWPVSWLRDQVRLRRRML